MVERIGHAGAMGYEPENTLRSFERAIALGCDRIELDVWLMRDGSFGVRHDDLLHTTTTGTGRLSELRASDLREVRCIFNGEVTGERVPMLDEVLALVRGRATLNVELKAPLDAAAAYRSGLALGRYLGAARVPGLVVSSFWHAGLLGVHASAPDLALAYLFSHQVDEDDLARWCARVPLEGLHPGRQHVDALMVRAAHDRGLAVRPYTANEPEDIAQLISLGVDGIVSNYPDRVPKV